MPRGELRAVLFDMDGTLLDSEKLWEVGLQDLCARLGFTLSQSVRERLVGMDQVESMELLHRELGLPQSGVADSAAWLIDRMKVLFAEGVVWQPGARELLASVRAAGFRTALVTATGRDLVNVIIDTIGASNFDVTVCGDEVTRNKPNPEPYATAVRALGLTPADCLAIEDSVTGVTSARGAGVGVLGVPSEIRLPEQPGVVVVESLIDVDISTLRKVHDVTGNLAD